MPENGHATSRSRSRASDAAALSASLPLSGTSDFVYLRTREQAYVDKTAYIERMLTEPLKYVFLARPRRFGKSLLLSTLRCLYARAHDDLFQGLDIQTSGFLESVPRCPVLALDMSDVAANSVENVNADLRSVVEDQCLALDLEPPPDRCTPWSALNHAIQRAHLQYERPVAVLVDEYDAPITDMLGYEPPLAHQDKTQILYSLRRFYRVLKRQDSCLEFVFVTGISRVEGAGLFSSLNNLIDISLAHDYGALCGFTEEEIQRDFRAHIACAAATYGSSPDDLCSDLRYHYNGYRFTPGSEPIYNPVSYLSVLKQLLHPVRAQEIRATGFPRAWVDTGMPYFLFQHMKAHQYDARAIEKDPQRIQARFDLAHPDLTSLMFQTGFLTYARNERGETILDYPNPEVEYAFKEGLLLTYLGQTAPSNKMNRLWREMEDALIQGAFKRACGCFNRMLDGVTFHMLGHESRYQGFFYMVCSLMPALVRVAAEVSTLRGRSDVVIETADAFVAFELKRNRSAQAAIQQIEERNYGAKYAEQGKPVYGVGLNFREPKGRKPSDAWDSAAQHWQMEQIVIDTPSA